MQRKTIQPRLEEKRSQPPPRKRRGSSSSPTSSNGVSCYIHICTTHELDGLPICYATPASWCCSCVSTVFYCCCYCSVGELCVCRCRTGIAGFFFFFLVSRLHACVRACARELGWLVGWYRISGDGMGLGWTGPKRRKGWRDRWIGGLVDGWMVMTSTARTSLGDCTTLPPKREKGEEMAWAVSEGWRDG